MPNYRQRWVFSALILLLTGLPYGASAQPLPPGSPDPTTQQALEGYLKTLVNLGFARQGQGIWIQSNDRVLADIQGSVPLPAASVTKAATTLAALQTYGPDYRFLTTLSTNGSVVNGVLQGDLLVQGSGNPFFVWEDAIRLGNALN